LVLVAERAKITAAAATLSQPTRTSAPPLPAPIADGLRSSVKESPAIPESAQTAGSRCISIGPFQDLPSAAQASATLKSAGRDSRQRLEQGQVWLGYWVTVPGFAKREDAERAVALLKQRGMADVYVSLNNTDAESSNVVSLGLFKEPERAQRMLTEAKNFGFAAQITDRTRPGSVYWVDVDFHDPESTFDFSILGAQPGKILRLEQRTCPAG
jgi:hypothetical protein